jgi:N-methylhydantoinase A
MRELGCGHAVIPLGTLSTTWSAYGCATSDLLQIYERPLRMRSPIDMDALQEAFAGLEETAQRDLTADGIPPDRQVMERNLEIKYPLQIHQLEVRITETDTAEAVLRRFVERYEQLYGIGSSWSEAAVEVVGCRVVARGTLLQPQVTAGVVSAARDDENERSVVWMDDDGRSQQLATRVISPDSMQPAEQLFGPLIIESDTTTVVVPPDVAATVTPHGDLMLQAAPADGVLGREHAIAAQR